MAHPDVQKGHGGTDNQKQFPPKPEAPIGTGSFKPEGADSTGGQGKFSPNEGSPGSKFRPCHKGKD